MLLLLLTACPVPDDSAKDSAEDTAAPPSITADCTGTGVTISIPSPDGNDGIRYLFGMAQTGVDGGWAREDCLESIPAGYEYMDDGGYQICHPISQTGLTLTTVDTPEELVEGETTLLGCDMEDTVTYVVFEAASPACWTWGEDVAYYAGLACTVI